jgi:hypothetical protein
MDTFDYILKLNTVRNGLISKPGRPDPSWVRITTITITAKFENEIDVHKIRENMEKLKTVTIRLKGAENGNVWAIREVPFYNQVSVAYTDSYSTKSVKIFPNGSVQVAGCSSLIDCDRVLKQVRLLVHKVLELETMPNISPPNICMINTNFSLNALINIKKLMRKFSEDPKFRLAHDPSRYSAVKIKFHPEPGSKLVTAAIFKSGRVIVTGARTLEEIVAAYEEINKQIDTSILVEASTKPETFDTFMGTPFPEWVKFLETRRNKNTM